MRVHYVSGTSLKAAHLEGTVLSPDLLAHPGLERETHSVGSFRSAGAERVLHYELQIKLGHGGMGVVYKALDQKLNRLVALKFLSRRIEQSNVALERFLQEANALSALNHRHVGSIYAVETAGEQQFLVLEYLPGGTLKAKLKQTSSTGGVLSTDDILKYAQQTAAGLAHAHARGVVHRDVKTSNLMLTEEDDVKITDFGVAKLSRSSLATIPGSLMGTIAYMSPEQVLGMDVDLRSDVFSFGVSLFELITGRLPFEAPTDAALITKVTSTPAPELKVFRSDVPACLERVVQTALRKRVEKRYQTMDDLLADLQAPGRGNRLLIQTRLATKVKARVGRSPKSRLQIVAAFVLLFAVIVTGVLLFWSVRRAVGYFALPIDQQLAVLRLRNVTGDRVNQALCDGLTEVITNKLRQLVQFQSSLSLVAASEVLNQNVRSARAARNALGATLVLEGSVQRTGDLVIVTVNLVDTARGTILIARDVEGRIEKLPELEDSLLEKIGEMLMAHLKPEARPALAQEI